MGINGLLTDVRWEWTGTEVTTDLIAGTTVLPVLDSESITEDESVWIADTGPYEIVDTDVDASTFTIASGLEIDVDSGTEVAKDIGGQPGRAWVCEVILADADTPVEVPLTIHDLSVMPEGNYDPPVVIVLSDDLGSVEDLPGSLPVVDGVYIPPDSLPPAPPAPPTDGLPPTASVTNLTVTGGIGALFVRWVPINNPDPVTYDLHVSIVSGFIPDASTLAVSTMGSSHTLRALPTAIGDPPSTDLRYDTDYYFRVIARDADPGTGPTSPQSAAARIVQVTGPDVAVNSVTADHIQVGTLTGDLFESTVVLGSTISTGDLDDQGNLVGARVDLGPDGLTTYAPDGVTPIVNFPLDPADDAFIHNAHLSMLSADVKDNLTVHGTNNELAASSTLQLGSGITAPSSPPSLASAYDTVQLDTHTEVDGHTSMGSFALDPSQITSMIWDSTWSCWQVFQQKSTGFRLWRFNPDGSLMLQSGVPWVQDIAGTYLNTTGSRSGWLFQFGSGGAWYVWSTVEGGGRHGRIPDSWLLPGSPADPFLAYDEASGLLMLVQSNTNVNDTMQVRRFHTVPYVGGAIQPCVSDSVTTSPVGIQRAGAITGCYFGPADFGGNRYVVGSGNYAHFLVWTTTSRYNGATTYQEWDAPTIAKGFHYDGANFWSVDSGGKLTKYTGWTWPNEPSTTWVGMSAYDSDPTGGTHETPVGTLANRNAARRSKLTVTVPATQDSGGVDDPDKWNVYWARTTGATVPTASAMHLVTALGSPTLPQSVTITADATGINPPGGIYGQAGAVNTFPSGNPAQILDGAGNVMMDAQGHGSGGMIGEVRMYAGATPPPGWLLCQGQAVARTGATAALYAVIGTTFGAGNGSTTFNLPDLGRRVATGSSPTLATGQSDEFTDETVRSPYHTHAVGGLTPTGTSGSTHTHGIPGQAADPSPVSGGTSSGFSPRATQFTGHAHGGDTTTTGSAHTHNITGSTGGFLGWGAGGMPHLTINFIIRT